MQCYICKSGRLLTILDKGPIRVWNGSGDLGDQALPRSKFRCKLVQCRACGHIQQPMGASLQKFLNLLYRTPYASVSTEIGIGSWGGRRGRLVQGMLADLPSSFRSALEIGCAGGYLLRHLKKMGFTDLTGIDPSIKKKYKKGGIQYRNEFVNAKLRLHTQFDLIISLCGFEHIQDVNDVVRFVHRHLRDQGILFFEVPYSLPQLNAGDPAVFLHEHVHHFTTSSLSVLLERNGFKITKIKPVGDSFFVFANKSDTREIAEHLVILYKIYETLLDRNIARVTAVMRSKKRVVFHGACNALHNLIQWGKIKGNFSLFDNDPTKAGKKYFDKEVQLPTRARINQYDSVIVAPSVYAQEIISQYRDLGFKGQIEAVAHY